MTSNVVCKVVKYFFLTVSLRKFGRASLLNLEFWTELGGYRKLGLYEFYREFSHSEMEMPATDLKVHLRA
jgi:hypothetical protein